MECKVVRQSLDAYLSQALGDEHSRAIEEHLFECEECFRAMTGSQEFLSDLDDPELQRLVLTEPPPLAENFTTHVMQRIEDEQPKRIQVIYPWLRKHWTRRQYASVAYAMSATMVVVSAGNLLFLWNQTTDQLSIWAAQGQAYWEALKAFAAPTTEWLLTLWQMLLHLN